MLKSQPSPFRPVREIRVIKAHPLPQIADRIKERLQSHRVEYPLILAMWRFVTAARGLLIITAVTGISALMNMIRTGHLKTQKVVITDFGQSSTIADDTVSYLAGAGIILGLGIVVQIILWIDDDLEHLQDQCAGRGVRCESALGLDDGVFNRSLEHRAHIQRPFRLARHVLAVVWLGWVYFIWSISS